MPSNLVGLKSGGSKTTRPFGGDVLDRTTHNDDRDLLLLPPPSLVIVSIRVAVSARLGRFWIDFWPLRLPGKEVCVCRVSLVNL